MNIYTISQF